MLSIVEIYFSVYVLCHLSLK